MAFCCYRKYLDKESKEWNHIIRRKSEYSERQHRVESRPFAREWSCQRWDIETGLVGDVTGNCVSVPVRMTAGRELVTDDAVMFLNDCREASAEQKVPPTPAERRPSCMGQAPGVYVRNLYAPKDGQLVKLSILDEHVILGAFRKSTQKDVVLYCLLDEDGSLRYSLHETVRYAVNLQILPIGTSGRSRLSDALRQKGLAWNGRLKELERLANTCPDAVTSTIT